MIKRVGHYVDDGWACVALSGLNVIQKRNHQGEDDDVGLYAIELAYQDSGLVVLVEYGPDVLSRDEMYTAVVGGLEVEV